MIIDHLTTRQQKSICQYLLMICLCWTMSILPLLAQTDSTTFSATVANPTPQNVLDAEVQSLPKADSIIFPLTLANTNENVLDSQVQSLLKATVAYGSLSRVGSQKLNFPEMVERFYKRNKFTPVWTDNKAAATHSREFLKCIYEANSHGLNPMYYHALVLNRGVNSEQTILSTRTCIIPLTFTSVLSNMSPSQRCLFLHIYDCKLIPDQFCQSQGGE